MTRSDLHVVWATVAGIALAFGGVGWDAGAAPVPPVQSASGPGGSAYAFDGLLAASYGEGAEAYWVIEPSRRVDRELPVVVFVHGFGQIHYTIYRAWITHLVRRGNVVIFPRYHLGGVVDPATFTQAAATNIAEALTRCDGQRHAAVDPDTLTMIGHSLGGTIVANLAARPEHFGLPRPKALVLHQPGDTRADRGLGALFPSVTEAHRTIAKDTLMLVVDVENDYFVSPHAGRRIFDNATAIDASNKRRLLMRSDAHGRPAIVADHMLPMGWTTRDIRSGRVNAYDLAAWRWFDAMQAAAMGDEDQREGVFGEAALDIGKWSDGTPVRRPVDASAK